MPIRPGVVPEGSVWGGSPMAVPRSVWVISSHGPARSPCLLLFGSTTASLAHAGAKAEGELYSRQLSVAHVGCPRIGGRKWVRPVELCTGR